jgi:hypothetical protein
METIRLRVSFDGKDLTPALEFIDSAQKGCFTNNEPIAQLERIDDLRLDAAQESSVLYGMMF